MHMFFVWGAPVLLLLPALQRAQNSSGTIFNRHYWESPTVCNVRYLVRCILLIIVCDCCDWCCFVRCDATITINRSIYVLYVLLSHHKSIENPSLVSGIWSGVFFCLGRSMRFVELVFSVEYSFLWAPPSGGGSKAPRPAVSVPHIDMNADGCRARQARSCKNTACRGGISEILIES